jgi:DNA polymerase-1
MNHLILVDGNNLGFAGMASPKLSAGDKATNSTFTFLRSMRRLHQDNPDAFIMVLWDGRSWRHDFLETYKANREKTEKQEEDRKAYYEQKKDITALLDSLGVVQCYAKNMEADDLAQIYSHKWLGERITLLSGDKDWLQLVDARTTWVDPIRGRQCDIVNFKAFTGCKNPTQFLELKCILGDSGDNIKGLDGVGPKTMEKLYEVWDSILDFIDDGIREGKWKVAYGQKVPSKLASYDAKKIYGLVAANDLLMNLATLGRPEPINLARTKPYLDEEKFKALCYENAFLSITRDIEKFIRPFKENKFCQSLVN